MKNSILQIFLSGAILLVLSSCSKDNSDNDQSILKDTIHYDYSYIYHYRNNFDLSKFSQIVENKYSRILLMPGYLTVDELDKLAPNIDTVINRICIFLNTNIQNEYNGFKGKVSYFIEPDIIPRTYGGSSIPIVSITKDNSLLSMYAHETVHIFSSRTSAEWLIEGLAVHLADTLGIDKLWPNYSENLNNHAKKFINNQDALNYIGKSGFFEVDPTTTTGEAFYSLSGSFVRYLIKNMGITNFMKCYSSHSFSSTLKDLSGKSFDSWKNEWLSFLIA